MTEALLLIDIQKGFDSPVWGERNNPQAEANAARLLDYFRGHARSVFHVQHLSLQNGSPLTGDGAAFKDMVAPIAGEPVVQKTVNSAFIGTNLEAQLRTRGITHFTICGLTTPHCVSTTTRMAANLGFTVTLAHDACAAFAQNADSSWSNLPPMTPQHIHDSAVSHLHSEFATARSVGDIVGHE